MRKETQKVVQGVVFGCVIGIFVTLFLVKELGLSPLWAVLLSVVFMVGAAIMYDPKDAWKVVKSVWNETCMWRPDAVWWRVLGIHGQGAIATAIFASVCIFILMNAIGVISGLVFINQVSVLGGDFFSFTSSLICVLFVFLFEFFLMMSINILISPPSKTGIKAAEKEKGRLYSTIKEAYKEIMVLPLYITLAPLIWMFTTIVCMPNWWYYSGKPFTCKVFTRLATAGRKVTFWCTGIGFATGVSYGLIAEIGYIAPTLIGTITGIVIAVLSVEIIPIKILKLQIQ